MVDSISEALEPSLETEPCTKPLSIPAGESLLKRYRKLGQLTKSIAGRNQVPRLARTRLAKLFEEIEKEALKKASPEAREEYLKND